jgi:hypothetical protein
MGVCVVSRGDSSGADDRGYGHGYGWDRRAGKRSYVPWLRRGLGREFLSYPTLVVAPDPPKTAAFGRKWDQTGVPVLTLQ